MMLFGGGLWVNWILCQHQSDWEVKQEVSHTLLAVSCWHRDPPQMPPPPPLHQPCLHVTVHVLLYYLSSCLYFILFFMKAIVKNENHQCYNTGERCRRFQKLPASRLPQPLAVIRLISSCIMQLDFWTELFLLFLNTTFSYKAVSPVSAFPEGNHLDTCTVWIRGKKFEIKICLALSIHIFLKKRIISYTATKGWSVRKPLSLSLPAEILSHQLKCIDIVMRQQNNK